jgi:hypothetical protein
LGNGCSAPDSGAGSAGSPADTYAAADGPSAIAEDLDGGSFDPLAASKGQVAVLVFVRQDCPISNRYAPTLRRLRDAFAPQGTRFFLVYPDPSTTAEGIQNHVHEYDYGMEAIRDPRHELVKLVGARVTPEAAVFDRDGALVYHGRIDNRYVAFGRTRAEPTTHELEDAIEATLENEPVSTKVTEAVGCYISDLQ